MLRNGDDSSIVSPPCHVGFWALGAKGLRVEVLRLWGAMVNGLGDEFRLRGFRASGFRAFGCFGFKAKLSGLSGFGC